MATLTEEGNDCDTRVTTDNGDLLILGIRALELADEAASTDNIEGSDTEETLGVVDTTGLEDLSADGDGGVDGVGDDEEVGLRARLSASFGQIADNGSVGLYNS